jgi:Trypsin-like peptidase domain
VVVPCRPVATQVTELTGRLESTVRAAPTRTDGGTASPIDVNADADQRGNGCDAEHILGRPALAHENRRSGTFGYRPNEAEKRNQNGMLREVGRARRAHLWHIAISFVGLIGCRNEVVADPDLESAASKAGGAVIVGGVDWQEASTLPDGTAERENSRAVGHLALPATGSRCTAFLITPDVVMTNQHCITSASAAVGATVTFDFEAGAAGVATYACDTFLGNDASLDFALLQCSGSPGAAQGVLELQAAPLAQDDPVYVVHQNCDWVTDPACAPTKKYSPGVVTGTGGELAYDADTLGGSSGSPVFAANAHVVIALHHVGVGGNGSGRGTANRGVPMTRILPVLAQRYPSLALGAQAPVVGQSGTSVSGDGYEPNNSITGARAVALPFSSSEARVDVADTDFFSLPASAQARTVVMAFSHAAGDLDLYAFDAAGVELARSVGTTDSEQLQVPAGAAATIAVVGYQGAVGPYELSIE